jgi:hypothetical protein
MDAIARHWPAFARRTRVREAVDYLRSRRFAFNGLECEACCCPDFTLHQIAGLNRAYRFVCASCGHPEDWVMQPFLVAEDLAVLLHVDAEVRADLYFEALRQQLGHDRYSRLRRDAQDDYSLQKAR